MPELPEMEAWRRALGRAGARLSDRAGRAGAHRDAEDRSTRRCRRSTAGGSRARSGEAKRLLFPTEDGELVLLVHLMTAGRLRYLEPGEKGPKSPAFRLRFEGGAELVLTEAELEEARRRLAADARSRRGGAGAPRAGGARARARTRSERSCASDSRRLHSLLRDQRAIAGIGRAWANEILHHAKLSPYALVQGPGPAQVSAARRGDRRRALARPRAARARRDRQPRLTASTASWPSRATSAGTPIARGRLTRSTRSTTAPSARPAGACSRIAAFRSS